MKGFKINSPLPASVVLPKIMSNPKLKRAHLKQTLQMAVRVSIDACVNRPPLSQYELVGEPRLVGDLDVIDSFLDPEGSSEIALEVECDVWPRVTFSENFKKLSIAYTRPPFDTERYEKSLLEIRERYARLKVKESFGGEEPVLNYGDATVVLMDGYFADTKEPLPEGKASGDQVDIIMQTGRYMEGLVEGLVGAKANEVRRVTVQFPEYLKDKELAGKKAEFDVTVLTVDERILPNLDDELAATVRPGAEGFSIDDLKKEVRRAVDEEGPEAEVVLKARDLALEEALLQESSIVVPQSLVTSRVREKFALMLTEMRDNGSEDEVLQKLVSPENFEKYRELTKADVERELKGSIVVEEVGRLEAIVVGGVEVEDLLKRVKKDQIDNSDDPEGADREFDEAGVRAKIEATLMRRYVMDFLAQNALKIVVNYESKEEKGGGGGFDQQLMDELLNNQTAEE
ncbi:hypothetical protein ScalyP_jg10114 [Parmales sp. scaly parma]|nr:hypothetical protein ScalyP_jg10114 [Parmales sp. scaly parma]